MEILNQPDKLTAMLSDLSGYNGILGPGPYWLSNQKTTIDWLLRKDLNTFRKYDRISKSLSNFGGGSRWRSLNEIEEDIRKLNNNKIYYLLQKLYLKPLANIYKIKLRDLSREKYTQKLLTSQIKLQYESLDIERELSKISEPEIGNPSDTIELCGKKFSSKFLDEFYKYLDIKKYVDFSSAANFLEIGPGAGIFALVLAKLFPKLKLYLIDIPPQLYVTQQFLSAAFPNEVASYEEIKENPEVLKSSKFRIFILAPWQIDLLKFDRLDLAFNQVSFSEMRKETVKTYLSHLSQWNAQIINIRAVEKNKTKEGPGFEDYVANLSGYKLDHKHIINPDHKDKFGETRISSALYFKKNN